MFQECGLALSSLQLRLWQPLPDSASGLTEDSQRESRTRGMSAMMETEGQQASAPASPGREEDTDTCWVPELDVLRGLHAWKGTPVLGIGGVYEGAPVRAREDVSPSGNPGSHGGTGSVSDLWKEDTLDLSLGCTDSSSRSCKTGSLITSVGERAALEECVRVGGSQPAQGWRQHSPGQPSPRAPSSWPSAQLLHPCSGVCRELVWRGGRPPQGPASAAQDPGSRRGGKWGAGDLPVSTETWVCKCPR